MRLPGIDLWNFEGSDTSVSDTLHRFWKKEHDWGWKKFIELSRVLDGFLIDDVLTIRAQVQVIRYYLPTYIYLNLNLHN